MERVPPEKPKRGRPPKSPAVTKEGLPLEKPKRGRPPKSPGVINPREEDGPRLSEVFSSPQVDLRDPDMEASTPI
ncbi:uncharacterized protein [Spinacia oleracea]|uniref:AT-hook motif nuclear-localized protein n=1 Tax=Spinacia oleracea TaxID=3562 RepID=A0ABM3RH72_SPIOL|nr:uncharacterized protein LOC130469598 [Spinacia oleracea]